MPKTMQIGDEIAEFPDDMSQEQIDAIIKRDFSIAGKANRSLASRGLTPQMVKAGLGETTPEQIQFAPPTQLNGGFGGGAAHGINPLNWLHLDPVTKTALAASGQGDYPFQAYFRNIIERGAKPTGADAAGAVLSEAGLPDPIGTAKESYRRGMANQSTADMYGNVAGGVAGGALLGKVAPMVAEAAPAAAGRVASRGFNKLIGATPEDLANGAVPGRGVASVQPSSWTGFGRINEITTGLADAKAAKDAFMANDVNAQYRMFDPEPLIQQAIDSKTQLATSSPALRRALTDFGSRMRVAVSKITNGEPRPLSAAEMDKLRDSIDANWNMANKQNVVVAQKDLKVGDAAIDMDRALRRALESDQSPVAKQYKQLNQRVQDLTGAKVVQSRTNTESLAPSPAPEGISLPRHLYNKAANAIGTVAYPPPLRAAIYNKLGQFGGLTEPLPTPQTGIDVPGLSGVSFTGLLNDPMVAGLRTPDMVGSPDAPPLDVRTIPAVRYAGNIQERAMQTGASQNTLDLLAAIAEQRKRSAALTRRYLMNLMPPQ